MDPARRPKSHDPGSPPSPYTRRPPHPPSRGTRYDHPPFLTSRWWTMPKKNRPFPALAGEERSIQGACHLTQPEPRKGPLRGQVPGGPDSQNAGFPEAGRMTWHPCLEQDTGAGGPYLMEWPWIPRSGPRDSTPTPKGPHGLPLPESRVIGNSRLPRNSPDDLAKPQTRHLRGAEEPQTRHLRGAEGLLYPELNHNGIVPGRVPSDIAPFLE